MTVKPKILVTSAAGHVGRPVVLQLRALGFPVRAFVRRRDARSVELEQAGAEIFIGDIRDFRDLRTALAGVHRAFHCPPYSTHTLYDAMLFAVAAEEARLEEHFNGRATKLVFEGGHEILPSQLDRILNI